MKQEDPTPVDPHSSIWFIQNITRLFFIGGSCWGYHQFKSELNLNAADFNLLQNYYQGQQ